MYEYEVTDIYVTGSVTISLIHNNKEDDREFLTTWDLYSGEIYLLDGYRFDSEPSKEQVEEYIEGLFMEYVGRVMSSHLVSDMNMSIHDDEDKEYDVYNIRDVDPEDEEEAEYYKRADVVILEDLDWGVIVSLELDIHEYEIERTLV